MEFFNKAKAVRLRSNHGKYLVADEDEETVRQSREGACRRARWTVEFPQGQPHLIRLKSCYGKYLMASDELFPLSLGKKVVQAAVSASEKDSSINWEPRTERFHVKLKARSGKFLRANGGMPPWRNSVTHDVPHRTSTQDWVLWEVHMVDILEFDSLPRYCTPPVSSFASSFSSSYSSDFESSDSTLYSDCSISSHWNPLPGEV